MKAQACLLMLVLAGCGGGGGGAPGDAGGRPADGPPAAEAGMNEAGQSPPSPTDGGGLTDSPVDLQGTSDGTVAPDHASGDAPSTGGDAPPPDALAPTGSFPGVTPQKLAADTPRRLLVSPDEAHVAFSNSAQAGGFGCGGAGDLSLLTLSAGGPRVVPLATGDAGFGEARFAGGGTHLVFITGICGQLKTLTLGDAETGMSRPLETANLFPRLDVRAGTVAWTAQQGTFMQPVTRVGAARIDRTTVPPFPLRSGKTYLSLDPTGTAIFYEDEVSTRFRLLTASEPISVGEVTWSPDGRTLVSEDSGGLVARNIDGSNARMLAAACRCATVLYSPDGTRVAYDPMEPPGQPATLAVRPVADGPQVVLTFSSGDSPTSYPQKRFSPGGRWLLGITNGRIALADTTQTSTVVSVPVDRLGTDLSAGDDFVAYGLTGGQFWVAPLPFTTPRRLLSEFGAVLPFQPRPGSTRLAVLNNLERMTNIADLEIHDLRAPGRHLGTVRDIQHIARTGFDNVRQPLWMGKLIVFPFNARALPGGENVFDLGAISEDGATAGTIATEVLQYTWRQDRDIYDNVLPNPTRIFFTRSRASGGGLWTVPVPE
jgi:hypothetical protein